MYDPSRATQVVTGFLDALTADAGFRLSFVVDADPDPLNPCLQVTFDGPDSALLTQGWGELLDAMQHLAQQAVDRTPATHTHVRFALSDTRDAQATNSTLPMPPFSAATCASAASANGSIRSMGILS